jgi:hypothetical protein
MVSASTLTPTKNGQSKQKRWIFVILLSLLLIIFIIVSLLPTYSRQQQYAELRKNGVVTVANIQYCTTDANNRPSTVTVRCPGTFGLNNHRITTNILGLPRPLQTGNRVTVLADPSNPSTVYPQADVNSGYRTSWSNNNTYYAALGAVLLILIVISQVIYLRSESINKVSDTTNS